jgi:hypothetical protein
MKVKWIFVIFLQVCLIVTFGWGQNSVTPGKIRVDSTFHHIGVLWSFEGDANLNSRFTIEYRLVSGGEWKAGAFPMRAHPELEVDGEELGLNYWAGSAMFLEPETRYEIKLTLTDPDGGGTTQTVRATTKKEQQPSEFGTEYYVKPGDGGGSGTMEDPFRGLAIALTEARPGSVFHLISGTYKPFVITKSGNKGNPIVIKGPDDKSSVIDGGKTSEGIVTIGDYEGTCGYIIIENLTIQNGTWGVDAQNTHDITFRKNIVRNVDWGYTNRREDGLEHDQTIADNVFMGRTAWPGRDIPDERGINIIGNNNVVCHNKIAYFSDGISTDAEPYGVSYSFDIYNNDISYCVDDLIEVDGTVANTRIWRNRLYNGRMGISVAPIMGGPCYIFRNELFNIADEDGSFSALKMNRSPSGLVVIHNTAVKLGRGITGPSGWKNTYFRNNALLSTEYVFELYELADDSMKDDWDFNAYASQRSGTSDDPEQGGPWFKWNDVRYARLPDLQSGAGIELNGIAISFEDLSDAELPRIYDEGVDPGSRDLTLKGSSKAINAGAVLSSINDSFVTDGAPDCGAFESGKPMPHYGPREKRSDLKRGE